MTEVQTYAADPWDSSSSDSPDRHGVSYGDVRHKFAAPRRRFSAVFAVMVLFVILADQFSKAWFVYRLGYHSRQSFTEFLAEYFKLFAGFSADGQLVTAHFSQDSHFQPHIPVLGEWVRWLLTTNTGAAWSMFAGNSLALSAVSIVIATGLFFLWRTSFRSNFWMSIACGAIIGGALGNFIDRFRLHEVVDFISVRIPLIGKLIPALGDPYDFPIFNVADAAAVCGTIGLALYLVGLDIAAARRRAKKQAARRQLREVKAGDEAQTEAQRQAEAREQRVASLHEAAGAAAVSHTPLEERTEREGGEDSATAIAMGASATDSGVLSVEGDSGEGSDAAQSVVV